MKENIHLCLNQVGMWNGFKDAIKVHKKSKSKRVRVRKNLFQVGTLKQ